MGNTKGTLLGSQGNIKRRGALEPEITPPSFHLAPCVRHEINRLHLNVQVALLPKCQAAKRTGCNLDIFKTSCRCDLVSDLAAQWAACHTDLTEVVLSECKFLTDKAAHMLSVLPALRLLRLDGAEALSDQGAAALRTLGPSLTSLDLSNTLVCACRPFLAASQPGMNCEIAEAR